MGRWKERGKDLIWTVQRKLDRFTVQAFGVVEIILILVIILGLVVIFKGEIETIVNNAIDSIKGKAGRIV